MGSFPSCLAAGVSISVPLLLVTLSTNYIHLYRAYYLSIRCSESDGTPLSPYPLITQDLSSLSPRPQDWLGIRVSLVCGVSSTSFPLSLCLFILFDHPSIFLLRELLRSTRFPRPRDRVLSNPNVKDGPGIPSVAGVSPAPIQVVRHPQARRHIF